LRFINDKKFKFFIITSIACRFFFGVDDNNKQIKKHLKRQHGADHAKEVIMKQVNVNIEGMDLDYKQANSIANDVARLFDKEPTVVAWHDKPHSRMSPVIEGADIHSRWHDYGESHGGNVAISVNGDYDFIFADSGEFEELGTSPYISVQDDQGNQFLCRMGDLRDPKHPNLEACFSIEADMTPSSMHAG
jgi:hypothetical protein